MYKHQSLVSIVIPTWQRNHLLEELLEHIEAQTYKKIEIIIVSDGYQKMANYGFDERFDCKVFELGRNWSGLDRSSFGIAPLLVGYLMANGDYVMPWSDDERALTLDHIEMLVDAMETPLGPDECNTQGRMIYPDFAYGKVQIWRANDPENGERAIIGTPVPSYGQITHYMFKPSNFWQFGYPDWGSHPVDWHLVEKWMKNGARWAFVDKLTFSHPLDQ